MTDRKLSRFFQGAKVSVGDVTALGRPASEMTDDEVAYICARYMQEQAEPSLDAPGGTLYPHGLPTVLAELWSYEDFDNKRQQKIRRRLRYSGFIPLTHGDVFYGYFVPNEWTWVSEAPVTTVTPEKAPAAPENPVQHLWACRNGDGLAFPTEAARDAHERFVHGVGKSIPEKKEDAVEAVESTTRMMALPVLTEGAVALLERIQKQPGLGPKAYNMILGYPANLSPLKKKGLVRTEGHTQNTRVFPVTDVPARDFPTRKGPNYPHTVRDRTLDVVKAEPGLIASQIAEKVGSNKATVMKTLTDLVTMKKVRATGKQPRHYSPYRSGGTAHRSETPKVTALEATVDTHENVIERLSAIMAENERLTKENARLVVEVASYAKVKELLGL